jgi:uncharacterized protein YktB (UPF0637 family)
MNRSKSNSARAEQESNVPVRPRYINLGTDSEGAVHTYRTADETVIVVADGGRKHVADVADRPVDDWMAFVRQERGWADEQYGVGLVDMLQQRVEVQG